MSCVWHKYTMHPYAHLYVTHYMIAAPLRLSAQSVAVLWLYVAQMELAHIYIFSDWPMSSPRLSSPRPATALTQDSSTPVLVSPTGNFRC